jgi:hypothetical protein
VAAGEPAAVGAAGEPADGSNWQPAKQQITNIKWQILNLKSQTSVHYEAG